MDWLWMILSLAGVLGLFFILVYAMKKLNSGLGYVNGSRMKVLDRVSLGKDGMLVVVSVADKLMLIGVTGQRIEKLSDIDMTPEEYYARQSSPQAPNAVSFASAFADALRGKKGDPQKENGNGDDKGNNKTES